MGNGYSTPTGTLDVAAAGSLSLTAETEIRALTASANADLFKRIEYDADLLGQDDTNTVGELRVEVTSIKDDLNFDNLTAVNLVKQTVRSLVVTAGQEVPVLFVA